MNKKLAIFCVFSLLCTFSTVSPVQAGPCQNPSAVPSVRVIDMIHQVNETLLFSYLENLTHYKPRYTGTESCTNAGIYLYNAFKSLGIGVEYHNWTFNRFTASNIVATIPGTNHSSDAVFIMSAHYDTTPTSPGADDDGSGVAALLAIASIIRQYSFNYTIRFIAFSGEEVGSYGSFCYARDAYRRGDNIVAVLNADMIGYANTTEGGQILRFFPTERARWIAEFATVVSKKYQDVIHLSIETLPNYIGNDAQAFIDYGYDGIWIAHPDGYPYGHSENDTSNRLNWTYYTKTTKLLLAEIIEFADTLITLQVSIKTPMEGYAYFFNYPIFKLDLGRAWYMNLRGTTLLIGNAIASANVTTNEPIKYVIFCVDGNFLFNWNSSPPYECQIKGIHYPFLGKHTLKVYAYTTNGNIATDEMDLHIFQLTSQFKKQKSH